MCVCVGGGGAGGGGNNVLGEFGGGESWDPCGVSHAPSLLLLISLPFEYAWAWGVAWSVEIRP